ncbi:gasdermin-A3-like isoform X2 [Rhineura floridana]|uniref:gasdermin-A3-like isoform X2 n=1 Tax=Rhineura floridana TaxID=261503 RepID=UPI002AC820A8|nr:gasdermin-A3-like isoform X2 [Rhineura floridana]
MSFDKATKSLAKQLDPAGDLIPVQSIIDQIHFRPFCLVARKRKNYWWQSCPYNKTEYKLGDVMLSGDLAAKLDIQDSGQITIVDQADGTLEGDIAGNVVDSTAVQVMGNASMSHARKIDLNHDFIKQTKAMQKDLYVITEAVEAVEEAKFEESNKTEGSIFYETYIKLKLEGGRGSKKEIIIPKACILAFRAKRLLIRDGSLGISHFPRDKTGTFDKARIGMCTPGHAGIKMAGKTRQMDIIAPKLIPKEKSKALQKEVEQECAQLSMLSSNLRDKFLTGLLAIMKENDFLQELELQLEQGLECTDQFKLKTGKPEFQDLVDNLQDSNGTMFTELADAVLYLLQALHELTEFQLMLLVESVEKKILNEQLALVGSILDNDFSEGEGEFTVDAQLLSEEELNITGAMITMSGATVKKNGSSLAGTGNPAAFPALSALYVALYALNALST